MLGVQTVSVAGCDQELQRSLDHADHYLESYLELAAFELAAFELVVPLRKKTPHRLRSLVRFPTSVQTKLYAASELQVVLTTIAARLNCVIPNHDQCRSFVSKPAWEISDHFSQHRASYN